jgi:hypothetical protein
MSLNFTKSKPNPNIYFNIVDDGPVILLLHMDDVFLKGEEKLITDHKKKLIAEFEMNDIGLMYYFLGLEVLQSAKKIVLN